MPTGIRIQRICQHCDNEFTAQTTVTKYCGDVCAKRAYKARKRAEKIEASNKQTRSQRTVHIDELRAKEFLTVKEVAALLSCSVRSVYYYIESGQIKATNLGQRMTRVKRSEIDKLFEQPTLQLIEPVKYEIEDCYTLAEVQNKYGISDKALYDFVKRNKITKLRKGKNAYLPKVEIHKHLGNNEETTQDIN